MLHWDIWMLLGNGTKVDIYTWCLENIFQNDFLKWWTVLDRNLGFDYFVKYLKAFKKLLWKDFKKYLQWAYRSPPLFNSFTLDYATVLLHSRLPRVIRRFAVTCSCRTLLHVYATFCAVFPHRMISFTGYYIELHLIIERYMNCQAY